jgi:peptidoglycan/xylan/chitin deacetylase (PgdA/CDA1 family)
MFWPDSARIAVTTSLMFEAGSQDLRKTLGPFPTTQEGDSPDLPTNSWFDYAANEGIPRALDLFDRHGVKATSFMTGMSAERYPDVARAIVQRGHEAAAHGARWAPSFAMGREEEKKFIEDGIVSVERITGQRAVGWNAHAMRNSANTLEILQELGVIYFIDDLSRDEPFIIPLTKGEMGVVPYTAHLNDLHNLLTVYDLAQFELLLKDEFDQLYDEGATRRRMMVVSLHDRLGTRPATIRMYGRVFDHMQRKSGVWFARKVDIARWALAHREHTPVVIRGPVEETGLPGPRTPARREVTSKDVE